MDASYRQNIHKATFLVENHLLRKGPKLEEASCSRERVEYRLGLSSGSRVI